MKLILSVAVLFLLSVQGVPKKCKQSHATVPKGKSTPPAKGNSTPPAKGSKIFAPYTGTWIYEWDGTNLLKEMTDRNLDTVIASFAIAQTNGNWAACNANQTLDPSYKLTWAGVADSKFGAQIKEVQNAGKEVIIAFGGYADPVLFPKGREIAGLITDIDRLAKAYIDFIKVHNVKRVDFDVEIGGSLDDTEVSRRRNDAILKIIQALPDIKISYTLPVESKTGLGTASMALLVDAASKNIPLTSVNLMTMNFGAKPDNSSTAMLNVGELTIQAIKATKEQFKTSNLPYNIGVIPMIGQNDFKNQIFTLDDAETVKSFVKATDYITYMGYWAMERDAPGVRPSGIGEGGCEVGFSSSKDSGTSAPVGAYVNALRL
jgi:hypothetical protein